MCGLSGCFELQEKVQLNANGSGCYQLMFVPTAKAAEALAATPQALQTAFIDSVRQVLQQHVRRLGSYMGISNPKLVEHNSGLGYSFDFSSINALNVALVPAAEAYTAGSVAGVLGVGPAYFNLKGRKLSRSNSFHLLPLVKQLLQEEDIGNSEANHSFLLHLPQGYKRSSNKKYVTTGKDELLLRLPLKETLNFAFSTTIRLR